ncbi:hypothetical protein CEXT_332721 [Caerostris extrusa]|uniref:Uncharacterized protein n=1 Tax=Caerostris extrusa TaxID=172846 RepID=A0AAV4X1J6_CAEEX|nr:hypothetical protein CEXT_332721 [Caerostris extrusa]
MFLRKLRVPDKFYEWKNVFRWPSENILIPRSPYSSLDSKIIMFQRIVFNFALLFHIFIQTDPKTEHQSPPKAKRQLNDFILPVQEFHLIVTDANRGRCARGCVWMPMMTSKISWLILVVLLSIATFGFWTCFIVTISLAFCIVGFIFMLSSEKNLKFFVNFDATSKATGRESIPFF